MTLRELVCHLLILVGIGALVASLPRALALRAALPPGRVRRLWSSQIVLILLFVAGYAGLLVWDLARPGVVSWLSSAILVLGGFFVLHTVRLGAHTIRLMRRTAALKQETITDPLTGLSNRRHMERVLEQQLQRCGVAGQPLSLLMIDLDHFKAVNDQHGHQTGDAVLARVSAALERQVRVGDLLARYGGEELIVVAPDADSAAAVELGQRLRRTVAGLVCRAAGSGKPVRCTISIGVASTGGAIASPATLIRAADQALYQAKRDGRDRVVTASTAQAHVSAATAGRPRSSAPGTRPAAGLRRRYLWLAMQASSLRQHEEAR